MCLGHYSWASLHQFAIQHGCMQFAWHRLRHRAALTGLCACKWLECPGTHAAQAGDKTLSWASRREVVMSGTSERVSTRSDTPSSNFSICCSSTATHGHQQGQPAAAGQEMMAASADMSRACMGARDMTDCLPQGQPSRCNFA